MRNEAAEVAAWPAGASVGIGGSVSLMRNNICLGNTTIHDVAR